MKRNRFFLVFLLPVALWVLALPAQATPIEAQGTAQYEYGALGESDADAGAVDSGIAYADAKVETPVGSPGYGLARSKAAATGSDDYGAFVAARAYTRTGRVSMSPEATATDTVTVKVQNTGSAGAHYMLDLWTATGIFALTDQQGDEGLTSTGGASYAMSITRGAETLWQSAATFCGSILSFAAGGDLVSSEGTALSYTTQAVGDQGTITFLPYADTLDLGILASGETWDLVLNFTLNSWVDSNAVTIMDARFGRPALLSGYPGDDEGFGMAVRSLDDVAHAPEPGTLSLLGLVLAGLGAARARKQKV